MSFTSIFDAQSVSTALLNPEELHWQIITDAEEIDLLCAESERNEKLLKDINMYSSLLANIASEGVKPAKADLMNALADSINDGIELSGGSRLECLDKNKFTIDDFSSEEAIISRANISEEDIKTKLKDIGKKILEKLLSLGKRIMEFISRALANEKALFARMRGIEEKLNLKDWSAPEGKKSVGNALCVDGKVDPEKAIRSFSDNLREVGKYASGNNWAGLEKFLELLKKAKDADGVFAANKALKEKTGKDADDAKIIAKIGGNVNIGVGNNVLYYVDVHSDGKKESEPLSAAEIKKLLSLIGNIFSTFKEFQNVIKKTEDLFKKHIDELSNNIAMVSETDVGKSFIAGFHTGAAARIQKDSGIAIISKVATLQYMTAVEAIKLMEWSVSGKPKKD